MRFQLGLLVIYTIRLSHLYKI